MTRHRVQRPPPRPLGGYPRGWHLATQVASLGTAVVGVVATPTSRYGQLAAVVGSVALLGGVWAALARRGGVGPGVRRGALWGAAIALVVVGIGHLGPPAIVLTVLLLLTAPSVLAVVGGIVAVGGVHPVHGLALDDRAERGLRLTRSTARVLLVAAAAVLTRLPFLGRPMGSDEGGLLLIASQWRPGSSLYGDYWVDRPPLLIDLFVVADRLGGVGALRIGGLVLVAVAVLLAARIGRLAGGSSVVGAVTAGVFLVNPLFGVVEVNAELIATPLVLAGIVLLLEAARRPDRAATTWALVGAGGAAAAAVLVKQNEIDVFVLVVAASLTFLRGPSRPNHALWLIVAGAATVTGVVLLAAALRGTGPLALWDAVVTFRVDASRSITSSATSATTARMRLVLAALMVSGVPLLLVQLARRLPRAARAGVPDLRWAVVALLAWESVSVLGGGSYWLHYLICLVPGLVLAAAVVSAHPVGTRWEVRRRWNPALCIAVLSCGVTVAYFLSQSVLSREDPVVGWLTAHARPGDTATVAFGHPDYLTASGLSSPYPQLWSLPVRVRDPDLALLAAVLDGPDRPDWVVTGASGSLSGWGLDARHAQAVLNLRYRLATDLGSRRIYAERDDVVKRAVGFTVTVAQSSPLSCPPRSSAVNAGPAVPQVGAPAVLVLASLVADTAPPRCHPAVRLS